MDSVLEKIEELANTVATKEGLRIYDLELVGQGGSRTLRVFIDNEAGGVGIDDCAKVSRGLSELLDSADPIPGGQYELEVSTPGLDRKLRKPWHFQAAVGKNIEVRLTQNLATFGMKNKSFLTAKRFEKTLKSADAENAEFQFEEETILIPYKEIEKAKVVFDFDAEKGKKK